MGVVRNRHPQPLQVGESWQSVGEFQFMMQFLIPFDIVCTDLQYHRSKLGICQFINNLMLEYEPFKFQLMLFCYSSLQFQNLFHLELNQDTVLAYLDYIQKQYY